jgi:glycerol-3-phosphate dehydrogenase
MAAETVDVVEQALGRVPTPSRTDVVPLPGGAGAVESTPPHLARAYGDRWPAVWALADEDPNLTLPLSPGLPYIGAEAVYAAQAEMACTLSDVLVRRTHIAFETRDAGRAAARVVASILAPRLGWTSGETARQIDQYDQDAERIFGVEKD